MEASKAISYDDYKFTDLFDDLTITLVTSHDNVITFTVETDTISIHDTQRHPGLQLKTMTWREMIQDAVRDQMDAAVESLREALLEQFPNRQDFTCLDQRYQPLTLEEERAKIVFWSNGGLLRWRVYMDRWTYQLEATLEVCNDSEAYTNP